MLRDRSDSRREGRCRAGAPRGLLPVASRANAVDPTLHRRRGGGGRSAATQARQAVDALGVVVGSVADDALRPFAGRPFVQLRALSFIMIERYGIAAGVGDAIEPHPDDRARARSRGEEPDELGKSVVAGLERLAAAVETHDLRRPFEGAAGDHYTPVLAQI